MDLELIPNETNIVSVNRERLEEDADPSERLRAPHLPQTRSRNSESICDQCSQVDWAGVPTLAARGLLDHCKLKLRRITESSSQLAASSCRICRILSLINSPPLGRRNRIVYANQLSRQWSSSAASLSGSEKITILSITPVAHDDILPFRQQVSYTRCLVALTRSSDKDSQLLLPGSINYDELKHSIRSCETNHGSLCTAESFYQVSGLRVIDVLSRKVVVAPGNCRYLALSYVWGQQHDLITGDALRGAPPLIEDSMSVAIALECKYLWVDRYCIPQDSLQEKHHMISHMDQVYANAFVTIIAAAGENVQMGLPGVSIFPRQQQQWVDIQNATLVELPCGEDDLLSSKWASRGWTYQEGYLSKRRIIFTPHQVLFLCNKQYLEEYVHLLLNRQDDSPGRWLDKLASIFPVFSQSGRSSGSSLLRQVEQYSMRELSYSSDSLNAFRGILNYYTTGHFGEPHLTTHLGWGLLAAQARRRQSLCVHLDWYHQAPAKRRYEFPSWTWTGWGGRLNVGRGILVHRKDVKPLFPLPHLTWEVSVQAEGEKTLDICDFASICLKTALVANSGLSPISLESSSRRLIITCRVLPIHFRKVKPTAAQRVHWQYTEIEFEDTGKVVTIDRPALGDNSLAVLEVWEGIYVAALHDLDQNLKQEERVMGLLFVSLDIYDHMFPQIGCLLARQVEEGFYERVGLVRNIIPYPVDQTFPPIIFLDEMGGVLERIKVSKKMTQKLFDEVGERKTICLL